jgi:hypothetical protein
MATASTAALAGFTQPAIVEVDLDAQTAVGDIISARDAKSDNVFIGCGTRNFDDGAGGVFNFAFCQAEDAAGDHVVCNTDNPELVRTIREINDSSFITFGWSDDGAGNLTCTSMGFSTQSFYQDKHTMDNAKGNTN